MQRYKRFLEMLYDHVQDDWDRLIPVVGGEGVGKSTLILESIWLYEQIRGNDPSPETVLDKVVFDSREAFRDKLLAADPGDPLAVMDATNVLYNKDVMQPDQKEVKKNLLDVRLENYVIFFGYQAWGDIPRFMRARRAKNAIRVLRPRGNLKGYNRRQLDEKYSDLDENEWPDPALVDTFPSLEGTRLWERFDQIDRERKLARLQSDEETETETTPQDVVEEIVDDDLEEFVEVNEFQGRAYYSKPLLRYEYPDLSDQEADQVRSALRREAEPETLVDVESGDGGEGDTHPPTGEGKT